MELLLFLIAVLSRILYVCKGIPLQNPPFYKVNSSWNPLFQHGTPAQNPLFQKRSPIQNPLTLEGLLTQNPLLYKVLQSRILYLKWLFYLESSTSKGVPTWIPLCQKKFLPRIHRVNSSFDGNSYPESSSFKGIPTQDPLP